MESDLPGETPLMLRPLATACAACLLAAPAAGEGCKPKLELESDGRGARLRPHETALLDCTLDEARYAQVVGTWLSTERPEGLRWLGLGRLVEYPWLSRALAEAALGDPAWDTARGRARAEHENDYVAAVLDRPAVRSRLGAPFDGSGYRVAGVSVEKVLVAPAATVLDGRGGDALVPFDVQLWLDLARDGAPAQSRVTSKRAE